MSKVIRALRREHANIATLVKALDWQLTALKTRDEADFDILRDAIDWFLSFPDLYHHPKEDLLFARLRLRNPEVAERIGDLRQMHEELAYRSRAFANTMRAMMAEAPVPRHRLVECGQRFVAMQVTHMRLEEDLLFPACIAAFSEADWDELEAAMLEGDDPLFGDIVGSHFERLRRTILDWQADEEYVNR